MKIENNKIVECTEDELFEHYLKAGFDEIFPFTEYKEQCEAHGTKVIKEGKKLWQNYPTTRKFTKNT